MDAPFRLKREASLWPPRNETLADPPVTAQRLEGTDGKAPGQMTDSELGHALERELEIWDFDAAVGRLELLAAEAAARLSAFGRAVGQ
jgi:hypothetical protein